MSLSVIGSDCFVTGVPDLKTILSVLLCAIAVPLTVLPGAPLAAQEAGLDAEAQRDAIMRMAFPDAALRADVQRAFEEENHARRLVLLEDVAPKVDRTSIAGDAMVRTAIATALAELGRTGEARESFDVVIKRYPFMLGPRLSGIYSLSFTSEAQTAARWWIELAVADPAAAKLLDGYTFDTITRNLIGIGHLDARDALYLALDGIGYDPGSITRISKMQFALFRILSADPERHDEARAALAKIKDPLILQNILSASVNRPFWEEIGTAEEDWRERVHTMLIQTAQDVAKVDDGFLAGTFLFIADDFVRPDQLVDRYLPQLQQELIANGGDDQAHQYAFWLPPLARALVLAGRPEDAEELYRTGLEALEGMDSVTRLNVSSNYAVFLDAEGRPEEALAMIEPAIEELERRDTDHYAALQMRAVRVVALHHLGRLASDDPDIAMLDNTRDGMFSTYADTMLLIGRQDELRRVVLARLSGDHWRAPLEYLQHGLGTQLTQRQREIEAGRQRLRDDPDIRKALARVGRIVEVPQVTIDLPPEAAEVDLAASYGS